MSNENLDVIIEYTRKFIDAAAPVAQQAYEIGLMTLRIDAAQIIFTCTMFLVLSVFILRKVVSDYRVAKTKAETEESNGFLKNQASDHLPASGFPHYVAGIFATMMGLVTSFKLLNLWLWAKLFAPELWLAHQAIEKIVR